MACRRGPAGCLQDVSCADQDPFLFSILREKRNGSWTPKRKGRQRVYIGARRTLYPRISGISPVEYRSNGFPHRVPRKGSLSLAPLPAPKAAPSEAAPRGIGFASLFHDCTQIRTMSDDRDDQPGHGTQVHRVGALFFWFHLAAFAFYGPASRRPAKSAAAEIPCRLLLPPAAAARNPGRGPSSFRQDEKKMGGALRRNRLVNRPRSRVQPLRLALLGTSPCRGGLEKRIAAPVTCKQKSPAGAGDLDSRFAFNGS